MILDALLELLVGALPRWLRWTLYAAMLAGLVAVIVLALR